MQRVIHFLGLALVLLLSSQAMAQSFYSTRGIGLLNYFVSGRSVGMGGVGLAVVDGGTLNHLNPAALAQIPLSYISGNFIHETADLQGLSQDASMSNTSVGSVQFAVPLKTSRVALAVGLHPFSTIEYSFSDSGAVDNKTFEELVNGDGGVNEATVSFAVRPLHNLYVGVTAVFHFGILRNKWRILFDSPEFRNTQDEVSRSFTAGNVRIGAIYNPTPNWSVGGVFSPSVTLDADKAIELENGFRFTDLPGKQFKIPVSYGVGTSLQLNKRFLIGVDFFTRKWSDVKQNGYVNNSYRVAAGFEFSARRKRKPSYLEKVAYRAGFYYSDLGLEYPAGEKVTEIFGTVGLGLPIKWNAARLDLSLELGRRGSRPGNPFEETVVKLTGTVTAGQKWFFRGPKR